MTRIILLVCGLLVTATPIWAEDKKVWTIDDHIAAIEGMIVYAQEVRDVTVGNPKYADLENQLAETEFRKILTDLEDWLALAMKAKRGNPDAVQQLFDIDQKRHRLLFTSAVYLGLDRQAYRAYVQQSVARSAMLRDLVNAHVLGGPKP